MHRDDRYLQITSDWTLSAQKMLVLYHRKIDVERLARVAKSQSQVSPIYYVHKDERAEATLCINMLALLAYGALERQTRRGGLQVTTRHIIAKPESLDVVETHLIDGGCLIRLVPAVEEQCMVLSVLAQVLAGPRLPPRRHPGLPNERGLLLSLPLQAKRKQRTRPLVAGRARFAPGQDEKPTCS